MFQYSFSSSKHTFTGQVKHQQSVSLAFCYSSNYTLIPTLDLVHSTTHSIAKRNSMGRYCQELYIMKPYPCQLSGCVICKSKHQVINTLETYALTHSLVQTSNIHQNNRYTVPILTFVHIHALIKESDDDQHRRVQQCSRIASLKVTLIFDSIWLNKSFSLL